MSKLFNTLRDVLTPYANKINLHSEEIEEIQGDVSEVKADLADVTNHAVKSAEQLISDKRTTDKVPYKYRASQSGKSDRAYDTIVGGTVCFNQLVKDGNFSNGNEWTPYAVTATYSNNIATIVTADNVDINSGGSLYQAGITTLPNHKYIVSATIKGDGEHRTALRADGGFIFNTITDSSNADFKTFASVATGASGASSGRVVVTAYGQSMTIYVKNVVLFDLTAMLGSTIADHIYSLEQATAGAGVALFRAMFPNSYYPYNAGSLISVAGLSAKEVVGFNRFDKSTVLNGYIINDSTGDAKAVSAGKITDYIPVISKQTYYIKSDQTSGAWGAWYDADKNYISGISGYRISDTLSKIQTAPANARYMRLTCFYNNSGDLNTFCVNVSNPARNGTCEPYRKSVYPLDSSLTLRGIPVLKDGKIEFDGDTYEADGTVTRRYAERAYQSGDESLANAITDGTNTVYKLSAVTTETATPYTNPQVFSPHGTEEYISESVCPVGHITEYPDNLRAKIDGLPWDLSMIAPVEVTYTATRNYTVNQLLIVDNTLYKVTANIANGGTITPNTNVVATTLSEVILALA